MEPEKCLLSNPAAPTSVRPSIQEELLHGKGGQHWQGLPREVVALPSLGCDTQCSGGVVQVGISHRLVIPEGFSSLSNSGIHSALPNTSGTAGITQHPFPSPAPWDPKVQTPKWG